MPPRAARVGSAKRDLLVHNDWHQTACEDEPAHKQLQRQADRVASLIVASDWPAVDLAIQIRRLREFVETRMPDRTRLFEIIYGSRFKRLWEQFRAARDGPLPEW